MAKASKSVYRTEDEYLAAVNELLGSATPVGAYCMGFAEALRREYGFYPDESLLLEFRAAKSVAEGDAIYERCREYRRSLASNR